jgi:carbon-monoxide dehydrogenase medium subunit
MKPPKFDYFAPTDIPNALALIAEHGEDSRFLAGGQSLVPMLNFRVAAPPALIDLNRIEELQEVRVDDTGDLHLGAMTRTRQIECDPVIGEANPLLKATASHIAHVQIRNRGTIGGSLAHADPAAELPGIAVACDALLHIAGPDGKRVVPVDSFFTSIFSTALLNGELLTKVVFPAWPPTRHWAFKEVSRREGDFAMVGIAAWFDTDESYRITEVRLAAIGAGDTPLRLPSAEAVLVGNAADAALFADAAKAGIEDLQPGSDIHASAEYRREVGGVLIGRVLAEAWERN